MNFDCTEESALEKDVEAFSALLVVLWIPQACSDESLDIPCSDEWVDIPGFARATTVRNTHEVVMRMWVDKRAAGCIIHSCNQEGIFSAGASFIS